MFYYVDRALKFSHHHETSVLHFEAWPLASKHKGYPKNFNSAPELSFMRLFS